MTVNYVFMKNNQNLKITYKLKIFIFITKTISIYKKNEHTSKPEFQPDHRTEEHIKYILY